MFERYTEKARRVIYFARYEASQFGSPHIESEHILLGLLREDKRLIYLLFPKFKLEAARNLIESHAPKDRPISTSVDLPLSDESKRILEFAADEADQLKDKHIGTEHLLLAMCREEKSFAAQLLRENGAELIGLREAIEQLPRWSEGKVALPGLGRLYKDKYRIHNIPMDSDAIRDSVSRLREHDWHWEKRNWKTLDVAMRNTGGISFDLTLAETDPKNFSIFKSGWKKGRCAICRWPLFESIDPEHGTAFTNGQEWVCSECHERFL